MALRVPWQTISHLWKHRPPPLSVRSLGLLGKVKLLCSAFKALRDAVLAQCPSLSAHCCPTLCSSTCGLLRHSEHTSVPLHWQFPPPGAPSPQLPTQQAPTHLSSLLVQCCSCVNSSPPLWSWVGLCLRTGPLEMAAPSKHPVGLYPNCLTVTASPGLEAPRRQGLCLMSLSLCPVCGPGP